MTPPTDLELMKYFDGELEEPRRDEVRAFLATASADSAPRRKLGGMALAGDLLREVVDARSAVAASIVDDVLRKIADADLEEPTATAAAKTAAATPAAKSALRAAPVSAKRESANDNGKFIFGLAAVAAAAAVALFVWGGTEAPTAPVAATTNAAGEPPAEVATLPTPHSATLSGTAEAPLIASVPTPAPDLEQPESEKPTEVAVDFGNHSGAVYYVPSEDERTSTAIVWMRDE